MPDRPDPPQSDDGGGYAVPTQFPAPPDVGGSGGPAGPPKMPPDEPEVGRHGPPQVPPEDPVFSRWGPPSAVPPDHDRWGQAPVHRYGNTALLDRPTSRRTVVAPPVRPLPPAPAQSWDWERSHRLRNALLAVVAILLIGSLIAALVVFRSRDDSKQSFVEPPPATVTIRPIAPTEGTVAPSAPVSLVPVVTTTTTLVPPPPTGAPPPPPTTVRVATPTTRRQATPTVTASPPYPGCPPCPTTTSTTRRSTTTTSTSTPTQVPG